MRHPIVVPHLGATGGDVKIVEWLVAEGQSVKAGDLLFVVETDKSTSEVEAFRDGTISIEGPRDMVRRFPTWFSWSPFYEATRRHLTGQQS